MFIDVHSHILPGIDDGARSINESRAMLERYTELGFHTVVATPHTYLDDTSVVDGNIDTLFSEVSTLGTSLDVDVLRGAEVRLTPDVQSATRTLELATLGDSQYVLVDFPSGTWPFYAEDALFQIQLLGYRPVLAHPERYWHKPDDIDIAQGLVGRGVLMQVTLGSVVGLFGNTAKRTASRLLEAGLVHVLATDAHGMGSRLDVVEGAIAHMETTYSAEALTTLLSDNPAAILADSHVEAVQCRRTRRRFPFGLPRLW